MLLIVTIMTKMMIVMAMAMAMATANTLRWLETLHLLIFIFSLCSKTNDRCGQKNLGLGVLEEKPLAESGSPSGSDDHDDSESVSDSHQTDSENRHQPDDAAQTRQRPSPPLPGDGNVLGRLLGSHELADLRGATRNRNAKNKKPLIEDLTGATHGQSSPDDM